MCLTHGDTKQIEILELGAEKSLLQGSSKENGCLMLKIPKLFNRASGKRFERQIWGEGFRVCDFLLIGWW